jgi:hypothetical protein
VECEELSSGVEDRDPRLSDVDGGGGRAGDGGRVGGGHLEGGVGLGSGEEC